MGIFVTSLTLVMLCMAAVEVEAFPNPKPMPSLFPLFRKMDQTRMERLNRLNNFKIRAEQSIPVAVAASISQQKNATITTMTTTTQSPSVKTEPAGTGSVKGHDVQAKSTFLGIEELGTVGDAFLGVFHDRSLPLSPDRMHAESDNEHILPTGQVEDDSEHSVVGMDLKDGATNKPDWVDNLRYFLSTNKTSPLSRPIALLILSIVCFIVVAALSTLAIYLMCNSNVKRLNPPNPRHPWCSNIALCCRRSCRCSCTCTRPSNIPVHD